jgi:hypothetical protein
MLNKLQTVFASLQRHDVKYVVIGGIAAVLHGVPRATFDVDILIEASRDNAQRLLDALLDAQLVTASLTDSAQLLEKEITVFNDRVRIDVQTATPGIKFEEVWPRRKTIEYSGQAFYILSKSDLITAKLAAGRPKDLDDVRWLQINTGSDDAGSS